MIQLGIFAKTFDRKTSAKLADAIALAGYECTQFNMASIGLETLPEVMDYTSLTTVKRDFEASRVTIPVISGTYNMIAPDPKVVEQGRLGFRVLAEASKALGYSTITLCTGTRNVEDKWKSHPDNAGQDAWREFRVELDRLIEIAETYDVTLGVEPEPSNVISSARAARRLLDEVGSERVKIVFDPFNLVDWSKRDHASDTLLRAFDHLADATSIIHAQDMRNDGKPCAPGRGFIDFERLFNLFLREGFSGPIIAHGFGESEAASTAAFLRDLLPSKG
ncbi:sugar phosphate isomerase/epimerase family protein [Phyllobacterium zundukense]|uniref:Sugar phosphate isomerase/epimerase n=1 Tax=Phyllobacterium zundukense TaxID=1867719 RepID=A0ACD4CV78_9HYPH|nr:sugar phosphate isomerase/epimerase family protein [Phyllobacterium zundukense]UXN57484.1 sugar phosphate isomerase/epimerase [Phyllobacterium zundukense]